MTNEVICLNLNHSPVKMEKVSAGKKVKVSDDYSMSADLYKCPECGWTCLSDNGNPHPDRNPERYDYDIRRQ